VYAREREGERERERGVIFNCKSQRQVSLGLTSIGSNSSTSNHESAQRGEIGFCLSIIIIFYFLFFFHVVYLPNLGSSTSFITMSSIGLSC